MRAWRAANPDRAEAYNFERRQWRVEHPEMVAAENARRRAEYAAMRREALK